MVALTPLENSAVLAVCTGTAAVEKVALAIGAKRHVDKLTRAMVAGTPAVLPFEHGDTMPMDITALPLSDPHDDAILRKLDEATTSPQLSSIIFAYEVQTPPNPSASIALNRMLLSVAKADQSPKPRLLVLALARPDQAEPVDLEAEGCQLGLLSADVPLPWRVVAIDKEKPNYDGLAWLKAKRPVAHALPPSEKVDSEGTLETCHQAAMDLCALMKSSDNSSANTSDHENASDTASPHCTPRAVVHASVVALHRSDRIPIATSSVEHVSLRRPLPLAAAAIPIAATQKLPVPVPVPAAIRAPSEEQGPASCPPPVRLEQTSKKSSCDKEQPQCWGAILMHDDSQCTPGYQRGSKHQKNKFCDTCRLGIKLPCERVVAITEEQHAQFANSWAGGVWASNEMGFSYRVVNHTAFCNGPRLLIFEDEKAPNGPWQPVPEMWQHNGFVRLFISKGTLVPIKTSQSTTGEQPYGVARPLKRRRASESDSQKGDSEVLASDGAGHMPVRAAYARPASQPKEACHLSSPPMGICFPQLPTPSLAAPPPGGNHHSGLLLPKATRLPNMATLAGMQLAHSSATVPLPCSEMGSSVGVPHDQLMRSEQALYHAHAMDAVVPGAMYPCTPLPSLMMPSYSLPTPPNPSLHLQEQPAMAAMEARLLQNMLFHQQAQQHFNHLRHLQEVRHQQLQLQLQQQQHIHVHAHRVM